MTGPEFPWLRPRTIGLDGATLAQVRDYEAHSLPGEPYDVEPSADLRDRVLALTRLVPQVPACEQDEDGPDIDCLLCEDSGEFRPEFSDVLLPCTECPRGDWTWRHELFDDMNHRGK